MTSLARLAGLLSVVLPLAVSTPEPVAAQTERTPIVTGGVLSGTCSTPTPVSVTAEATPGHSIAHLGAAGKWLAATGSTAVLLSFIDPGEHSTTGPENPDMSRRLLVFLRSVRTQHPADALVVALIDGSGRSQSGGDAHLVNFRFDNELADTPMLVGAAGRRAMRELGVRCLPTTFLVDRDARITARWEGLVLPSTIATAIAAQGHGRAVVR